MRRGLIIGLFVSICFHGGGLFGPILWAKLFPATQHQADQTSTAEVSFWVPPPLPEIPPDPTDPAEDQQQDVATVAPPSLLDVPGDVHPDSFTEVMAPPPPPSLGKPDASMMTVPKGNLSGGRVSNNLGQIFNLSDLDQQPDVRGIRAEPVYPTEMKRQGVSGNVVLEFIVDSNGDVREPQAVSSSHREFESPAIQAVLKWKFRPGKKGGKNVNTRMRIPIEFNLADEDQ